MCNIAIYSVTLFCYTSCERGFCMEKWISKKELLAKTGISYGQLYRWKREKLIPDDWFIKRAAFTGQETFFPRERVLERISFILENRQFTVLLTVPWQDEVLFWESFFFLYRYLLF